MVGGQFLDDVPATGGVLHAGGGDQHDQQQLQRVDRDVPFAAFDLLSGVDALAGFGHIGRGPDRLGIDDRCAGDGLAALGRAQLLAQLVMDRRGGAVLLPFGVVVVDSLVGRDIMRQVLSGDPGAVHVQDRARDLA
jgi:hypothetical protein